MLVDSYAVLIDSVTIFAGKEAETPLRESSVAFAFSALRYRNRIGIICLYCVWNCEQFLFVDSRNCTLVIKPSIYRHLRVDVKSLII